MLLFFAPHFSARVDFPPSPLSAPGSPRMPLYAGQRKVLQRNSLYSAARSANLEGILGFSVPSIILVKAGLMQITM